MSNQQCKICDNKFVWHNEYRTWIACDECDGWFHVKCLNKPDSFVKALGSRSYYCKVCTTNRNRNQGNDLMLPSTSSETPSAPQENSRSRSALPVTPEASTPAPNPPQQTFGVKRGHSLVEKVIGHCFDVHNRRQFQVLYTDGTKLWHFEDDLKRCIPKVNAYCAIQKLQKSSIKISSKVGSTCDLPQNEANWISIERTLQLAITYGDKNGIIPQSFNKLEDQDGLYLAQLADHCYVILWLASDRICYIADGLNTFIEDNSAKEDLLPLLGRARIVHAMQFDGQKANDHCASSAAALAIEFQRLYKQGIDKLEQYICPAKGTLKRIQQIAHKEPSAKIDGRIGITQQTWGVTCPKCGKKLKSKNRGALSLHKCWTLYIRIFNKEDYLHTEILVKPPFYSLSPIGFLFQTSREDSAYQSSRHRKYYAYKCFIQTKNS